MTKEQFNLNDRSIKALPIRDVRYDKTVAKNKGLIVRVYPTGVKKIAYIYSINRRRRVYIFGEYPYYSITDANKAYFNARSDVEHGIDPVEKLRLHKLSRITISGLADDYIAWCTPRKLSWREDQRLLNHDVLPKWGNRLVGDIRRAEIKKLLDDKNASAPAMANRIHATLHTMFKFAVEEREIIGRNPMSGMRKPAKAGKRKRTLTNSEIATHWHGIYRFEGSCRLICLALLLKLVTAQRSKETLNARWDDIDMQTRLWVLPEDNTKSHDHDHRVPLSPLALRLLDEIKVESGESLLFPSPAERCSDKPMLPTSLSRALGKYLHGCGLTKNDSAWFTVHDLRRTAATGMGDLGIELGDIKRVLNHTEGSVTSIYDRSRRDPEKRAALDAWSRKLETIIAGDHHE